MRVQDLPLAIALIGACMPLTAACSSRAIAKPRPTAAPILPPDNVEISTTPRPNVTFPTFVCPPSFDAWYCLNDGTCFTVVIHNEHLYNCECAMGFMGPRCEFKELDGSYLPTRNRVMLEKASIVSGATLALLFMAMCCVILYLRHEKLQKQKLHDSNTTTTTDGGCQNEGMDEVDGLRPLRPVRRPFGPCRILSLEEAHLQAAASNRPRHCN